MITIRNVACLTALLCASTPALAQSMTAAEAKAEAVWKLRAALNVAALQCQYDPSLKAVDNYNQFSKLHKPEIDAARTGMENNHRRRFGKAWAGQFDRYNTRTYNGFSATDFQVAYCNKMADVGAKALALTPGSLTPFAETTVPEIRAIFPQPKPVTKAVAKATTKKSKGKSKKKKSAKKKS